MLPFSIKSLKSELVRWFSSWRSRCPCTLMATHSHRNSPSQNSDALSWAPHRTHRMLIYNKYTFIFIYYIYVKVYVCTYAYFNSLSDYYILQRKIFFKFFYLDMAAHTGHSGDLGYIMTPCAPPNLFSAPHQMTALFWSSLSKKLFFVKVPSLGLTTSLLWPHCVTTSPAKLHPYQSLCIFTGLGMFQSPCGLFSRFSLTMVALCLLQRVPPSEMSRVTFHPHYESQDIKLIMGVNCSKLSI